MTSPSQFKHAPAAFQRGVEGLGMTFASFAQAQLDDLIHTFKRLFASRDMDELSRIQAEFMQQSFDRLVGEASKIAQTTANLAKDTVVPLNDEMENMVQKLRDLGRSV